MALKGRCLCEGVQFEIEGELGGMGSCHCTRCQRSGGGEGSTVVLLESRDSLRFTAGEELVREYHEDGFSDRFFCERCGSSLYGRFEEMTFVSAGTLADDPGLRPQFHMMVDYKAPWHEISDELPQFPEYPPME